MPTGRGALLALLLLLAAAPGLLTGQPRRQDALLYEPVPPIRFEAWNAPSADRAKSRLDVHLWIQPSQLVFIREPGDSSATPFVGRADISIEVFDSARVARARRLLRREVRAAAAPETPASLPPAVIESVSFDLAPGSYTVSVEVGDAESQRRFAREHAIVLADFTPGAIRTSSLFWCRPSNPGDAEGSPLLFWGGVIPLGEPATGYFSCTGIDSPESTSVAFRLYRVLRNAKGRELVLADTLSRHEWYAGEAPKADTTAGGRYHPSAPSDGAVTTFVVPFASDSLPLGTYDAEIVVASGGRVATRSQSVSIAWIGMPRTLMSLPASIQALEYIMPKEEFAALRREGAEEQRAAFEAFWRKQDTTPRDAFNEFMEEYYRRADIAAQEFATIRNPNGITTDRGKVLILYGPPTTKERILGTSSAPREIWRYEALRKSLIFLDERRTGDYKLATEQ